MIEKSFIIVVECICMCIKDENCLCKRMYILSCLSVWMEYKLCLGGLFSFVYVKVKRMCDCILLYIFKF